MAEKYLETLKPSKQFSQKFKRKCKRKRNMGDIIQKILEKLFKNFKVTGENFFKNFGNISEDLLVLKKFEEIQGKL